MSEINWNEAPEGAERYDYINDTWLMVAGGNVLYWNGDDWVISGAQKLWENALISPVPHAPEPLTDWTNPIYVQQVSDNTIDATIAERGLRYGKFEDGAVIMQKLKTVMRETEGWQRLKPNQREALEMIQHKIWRVLNGDPDYDDNWRDVCGYSQLVLDQLNGESK